MWAGIPKLFPAAAGCSPETLLPHCATLADNLIDDQGGVALGGLLEVHTVLESLHAWGNALLPRLPCTCWPLVMDSAFIVMLHQATELAALAAVPSAFLYRLTAR